MKTKFDALFVAGMHRSGTSAVAKLVGEIGYYLGDNLISPSSDNPRGFFEDSTLVQFNIDFLEKCTGDGYHGNIASHTSTICDSSFYFDSVGIQKYFAEKGFLEKPFIFKDPRLCLTFPLWQSLLVANEKNVACIVPFRNPLEVALSLKRRNNFSLDYGLSLWFIYNVSLLKNIVETPALFVEYDNLINNSSAVVRDVVDFACLETKESSPALDDYRQKFLTKKLRHHTENSISLHKVCIKMPMVALLYEDMKALSKIKFPSEDDIRKVNEKYASYMFYDILFGQSNVSYQLFLDCGHGYSEEDSITINQSSHAQEITFTLPQSVSVQNIRLDVGNSPCIVKLHKVEVTYLNGKKGKLELRGHNALKEKDMSFVFATTDPQLYFICDKLVTHIAFVLSRPTFKSLEVILQEIDEERLSRLNEIGGLNAKMVSVENEFATNQSNLAAAFADLRDIREQFEAVKERLELAKKDMTATQADLGAAYTESHNMRWQLESVQDELAQAKKDMTATKADLGAACTESHNMRGQLESVQDELVQAKNDLATVQADLGAAYTESHNMRWQLESVQDELVQAKNDLATVQADLGAAYTESHLTRGTLEAMQSEVIAVRSSLSWGITAPLRFGFEVLASPVRAVKNFNMKHILFAMRYSKSGASLYTTILPQSLKNLINDKWTHAICAEPESPDCFQQTSQSYRHQNTQSLNVNPIYEIHEPRFVPDLALYEEKNPLPIPKDCPVKLIAFYLPQFHPIPENDEWWGEGFTEWTNVTKAKPLFVGHYQPRLPGAMGFYDLRLPEVLRKQAALAKEFGLHGFCFHHYDFCGKRLLEAPVDNLLLNTDIDLPFCLCWANENWTRRWDGKDNEILIAQAHSPEDDIRFIKDIQKYFDDPRYIRVEGKPFLIVYKASQFPDMAATIARWRDHAAANAQGLYLVMAQTFGVTDPRKYGFDAAVEFPPHLDATTYNNASASIPSSDNIVLDFSNVEVLFKETQDDFLKFSTVTQNWDNTARRANGATIFSGITPNNYKQWLEYTLQNTHENISTTPPFVFINAWNEWAEGAYLEPDRVYGYAYLNATNRALAQFIQNNLAKQCCPVNALKVLFVLHDCARAGAQIFALSLLRWIKKYTAIECYLLIIEKGGVLTGEFESIFPTVYWDNEMHACDTIRFFCKGTPDIIYGNTVVSTQVYESLGNLSAKYITHIHELQDSIAKYAPDGAIEQMMAYTNYYIAPSQAVAGFLTKKYSIASNMVSTVHEFIHPNKMPDDINKMQLRKQLGIPLDACIILACGSRSVRKGTDVFVRIIDRLIRHAKTQIFACWVGGHIENSPAVELECCESGCSRVLFIDEQADPSLYFLAADIFALPSREDPFPLVCLEAADAALPIVCFAEAGGMPEFVEDDAGIVVSYMDEGAFANALSTLASDKTLRTTLGKTAKEKLLQRHTANVSAPQVLDIMRRIAHKPHPVTVIVPNYNYAHYLDQRLYSIANQSYRDYAVIFLDDASTDNSLSIFAKWEKQLVAQIIKNKENSGSVMSQWQKGIEFSKSDILWIAEADDDCSIDFLEKMIIPFSSKETVFVYSIPNVIDDKGSPVDLEYRTNYLSFASDKRWNTSYCEQGIEEAKNFFSVVNCAPNVSACLMRKLFSNEMFNFACSFKSTGDWALYLCLAKIGNFAYVHDVVAWHRRHEKSIIGRGNSTKNTILLHETKRIHAFAKENFQLSTNTIHKMNSFCNYIATQDRSGTGDSVLQRSGFCPCCQQKTIFRSEYAWLHDHYRCNSCHSLPRDRALHKVLHDNNVDMAQKTVLEFAPTNAFVFQKSLYYTASNYFQNERSGIIIDGILNLNMEEIALPDNSYDIIIHEDIFEHIFAPQAALKELVRICKPGGHIIFTVPINDTITTQQRSEREVDGCVRHILPEEYHGNPVGDGRALVVWDYGKDFSSLLHVWSLGLPISWQIVNSVEINNGIEGEYLHVVCIRKHSDIPDMVNSDVCLTSSIVSNGDFSGDSSDTLSILWSLTQKCNYRCSYCFCKKTSPFMTSKDRLFATVDKLLEMKRKAYQITLYGGEPTLHTGCLDLLQYISTRKSDISLRLITNGSSPLIFFEKMSKFFEKKDVLGIVFSVHFQHVQFDRLLKNIELTAKSGFPVGVNVMYYPPLRDKIHLFVDRLLELRQKVPFHFSIPFVYTSEGDVEEKNDLDVTFVEKAIGLFSRCISTNTTMSPFYTRVCSDATIIDDGTFKNIEKSFSFKKFNLSSGASIDYTGYYCCNGLNVYYIEDDGNVYGGVCREAQLLGNIFSSNADDIIGGCTIHKCGSNACQSIENIPLPKFTDIVSATSYFNMYKSNLLARVK